MVDLNGAPVVNAEIAPITLVFRSPYQPPQMMSVRSATTDANGRYRIGGLPSGEYLVAALSHTIGGTPTYLTVSRLPAPILQPNGSKLGYVTTFYPGVTATDRAQVIQIGQTEVVQIDFSLQRGTVVDVRGVVTGGTVTGAVALAPREAFDQLTGFNVRRVAVSGNGTFMFVDVPPGNYFVNGVGSTATARVRIVVSPAFRETVTLALEPNVTVKGRIEFRGDRTPTSTEVAASRVALLGEPPSLDSPYLDTRQNYVVSIGPDGGFTISNVRRGRYRLFPVRTPSPWQHAASIVTGVDAKSAAVTISADVTDAVVALTIR